MRMATFHTLGHRRAQEPAKARYARAMADLAHRTIELTDGRELAYCEFGDSSGTPLLYFHGFPGSRLEPEMAATPSAIPGVRLIAVDRPGFGRSSPQPGRRLVDWPHDVAQLADGLGLERFACMGVSGGGPYALACAHAIPERLTRVACVAGVGPFGVPGATEGMMIANRMLFTVARYSQAAVRLAMWPMLRQIKRGSLPLDRMAKQLPPPDREVLERPGVRESFVESAIESLRQGLRAVGEEAQLYSRDWGFAHADIGMEVHLYQGELDRNVSPSMGRWQAGALPHCKAHFYPDEGHLSLVMNRMDEIVENLK